MSIIAVEEHWTSPALDAALAALPAHRRDPSTALNDIGDHLAQLHDLGAGRLAAMDAQGVDLQVLSVAPPSTGPLDPADAVALSRELNDTAAAAVADHPRRLRAMATLPTAHPSAVAAELERAADRGLVGAMVYGRSGDILLDDPRLDDLFAVAAARALPVFVHPQVPPPAVRDASYSGFGDTTDLALATFGWGWHVEAAVAVLRLIARGTFDRYPGLTVVLGHWGELLPYWADRANGVARVAGLERSVPEYVRENIVLTCSGMLDPAHLRHALAVTTPDRLLFSTDHPFQHPSRAEVAGFLDGFAAADRDLFTEGNARRLFRIEGPVGPDR
ncbi:amidohydrolase family protein [Pseudonocardia alni]|jgi:predicted TIM-barrel fold metal-dependent hydrolase|uniref:amidohydrolase family protein n=1 Tax=Pseudonocardia TaxID=1847 RepID=UPI0009106A34|nr:MULTISPECIES: amidohydrolase family protein [unclassified Pseudonocardia]MCO7196449.1 amidohydrolase family protein [Pseudonocardia sp. McavD-2-B]MYW71352.1 amidohydrolase family protein [Pseudonocardia sp. SID8383]OJG07755.1 Amidohydrolase [Pseudonocardia autotrophica]